jgi:hypothetical protein
MRKTIRRVLSLVVLSVLGAQAALVHPEAQAQAPIAGTESVTAVFSVDSQIAGYDPSQRSLRFYSWRGDTLRQERSIPIDGSVLGVTSIPNGYAVATGMGRDNLSAPARVEVFTGADSKGKVVFERSGERNQINTILWRGGKLWLNFFASKYMTTIGYLTPAQSGDWAFTEIASVRMGDSLDVVGDLAIVGRSYGDIQAQDGDLLLFKGGERMLLPSYRGVRSTRVVGDAANHRIFIGDGWHMNYGQLAQGRLSVVSKRAEDPRYTLQILDYDPTTTDFRRLIPFRSAGHDYIAAQGSSSIVIYDQVGAAPKKIIYRQDSQANLMDLAVVQVSPDKALAVVADQGLRTFEL